MKGNSARHFWPAEQECIPLPQVEKALDVQDLQKLKGGSISNNI